MDKRLSELIDYTKETWGLAPYYLGRHQISRKLTVDLQTIYILNMEWFPSTYANWTNEEENPEGTASIDIDFHSKEFLSAIFVEGKTYAENGIVFPNKESIEVQQWLAYITGYKLEEFALKRQESNYLYYEREVNGIPISPISYLEVEWDEQGQLTSFTKENINDENAIIIEETFSLSVLELEELMREQVKLGVFPTEDDSRLVYGIGEVLVRNDKKSTIPFYFDYDLYRKNIVNQTIVWTDSKKDTFTRKSIPDNKEVTTEQANAIEPHPDTLPIGKEEIEHCLKEVTSFLQMKFPHDSGKWVVTYIYRDRFSLHVELEEKSERYLQNKLLLILDHQTKEVLNYMEKGDLWRNILKIDNWNAKEVKISKTEAFQELKKHVALTPIFVYSPLEKKYVLCGNVHCSVYIDAENGQVLDSEDAFMIY